MSRRHHRVSDRRERQAGSGGILDSVAAGHCFGDTTRLIVSRSRIFLATEGARGTTRFMTLLRVHGHTDVATESGHSRHTKGDIMKPRRLEASKSLEMITK